MNGSSVLDGPASMLRLNAAYFWDRDVWGWGLGAGDAIARDAYSAAWRLRNALIDVIGWLSRAPCTNLNLFLLTKELVNIYY